MVATTTRMNYTRWRKDLDSKFPGWEIVNRFHPLPLEAKLSDDELDAAGSTSYAGDLASIEQLGLGRVLGRAEDIRRRFTSALDSHQGRAGLVKAAVDWSRAGLGAASKETLLTLAKACDDDLWEEPDWEAEWSWVIGETTTNAPLVLHTGKDSWEALDLLAEDADWPLTETTLKTMATCPHTAFQAVTLVFEMHSKNLLTGDTVTENLVQKAADLLQEISSANPSDTNLLGLYAVFLTDIRPDHNQAKELYQQALKADPNNPIILGNYALFLTDIRHDHDHAEKLYTQAIKANPNNATKLGNYANFLTRIRRDHDRAEELYTQAIAIDSHNATNLGRYALFLTYIRHNHDQAEKLYKQALTIDPNNATKLGNYATFLTEIRRDHDQAEELYTQALTIDPNNANNLGNYSQFLFVTGRDEKGAEFAERALGLAERGQEALCAEYHFYLFMHSPRHRITSGRALKALLADGVTTDDWSFEGNLERLTQEEDPRYELARAVAEALRTGDTSALNDFEEWRDLDLPDREE